MTGVRSKLEAAHADLADARVRISALEEEVRRVRAMDTDQRVLHEQKLRVAAENRLVQHIKEQHKKDAHLRAQAAANKNKTDGSARVAGLLDGTLI